ncbi:MAG: hypothetical protein HC827_08485 [Cyanobacteria bacterium RM1_2_2]|nr:hypothetical protein [Cyanobacteria bacterium RM1_2_2]
MVKRSPNATLTSKIAIDQATAALQDLPDKPKENVSLREAVDLLQDDIIAALNKGYSYEEMTEVLSQQGISIAPSSLKHYLARSKRQAQPKTAATKTRQPRSTAKSAKALPQEEEEPVVEDTSPDSEAPETPTEATSKRTRSTTGSKSASKTTKRASRSPSTTTTARRGRKASS